MIEGVTRFLDNLTGRGEAAVTVPPLDGALRANSALDEAEIRAPLPEVDCLAVVEGVLHASAGRALHTFEGDGWRELRAFDAPITCIVALESGGLAIALGSGEIVIEGGPHDGQRLNPGPRCITALASAKGGLFIANGSTVNAAEDWQTDLMQRRSSGEVWYLDLATGEAERRATGLGWPAGLVAEGDSVVISEAWRHRLLKLDARTGKVRETLYTDLPGYPGRLTAAPDGYWLAVFAPRSQLVEFVLREPAYRRSMIAEMPRPFWIAPCLRSGQSFYEPLQGGSVKQLGLMKPWAPTMSSGLCVRLDTGFQPLASLHSRANGATHGVTSVLEQDGRVWAAAKGDGVVAGLTVTEIGR